MQVVIKLFTVFVFTMFLCTSTYAIDKQNSTKKSVKDKKILVKDITSGKAREGSMIEHKILLSATPNIEIELPYAFENNTTLDDDYYQAILIAKYPNGTIRVVKDSKDEHKGIIFVKGLKEFSFKVETVPNDVSNEPTKEYYNITVGGKTAKGTIVDDS